MYGTHIFCAMGALSTCPIRFTGALRGRCYYYNEILLVTASAECRRSAPLPRNRLDGVPLGARDGTREGGRDRLRITISGGGFRGIPEKLFQIWNAGLAADNPDVTNLSWARPPGGDHVAGAVLNG